jgi:hypothetical protein
MRKDFDERRAARADRLESRAAAKITEANDRLKAADSIASHIPFGQPILVGHHSEGRHRRDIARIDNNMRKGFALQDEAKDLERRAEAARNNTAIFSDDPNATEKLSAKIERLEARQAMMTAANKLVRKNDVEGLINMGFSPESAAGLLKGDFCGRKGFASYVLSNNGANIRRLKDRLQQQQKLESLETRSETVGGVEIVQNAEINRTQIFFPGKPDDATRGQLKMRGFRWAPSEGAWQRHLSSGAEYWAREIVKGYAERNSAGDAENPENGQT